MAGTSMLFGLGAFGPVAADLAGDVGAVPVAADDQRLDVLLIEVPSAWTTVGSSIRISSANDSSLPLCGVAEARIRASVRGEQPGQPVVLGRGVGDVVGLVDDDGVPVLLSRWAM